MVKEEIKKGVVKKVKYYINPSRMTSPMRIVPTIFHTELEIDTPYWMYKNKIDGVLLPLREGENVKLRYGFRFGDPKRRYLKSIKTDNTVIDLD